MSSTQLGTKVAGEGMVTMRYEDTAGKGAEACGASSSTSIKIIKGPRAPSTKGRWVLLHVYC